MGKKETDAPRRHCEDCGVEIEGGSLCPDCQRVKKGAPKKAKGAEAAKDRYIAEIDKFATILKDQQKQIDDLVLDMNRKEDEYTAAKRAVREAKEYEHETVALLLKFIRPGSIDIMPLFDTMEPADEARHGTGAADWRKEPITALGLSALAMKALIAADIVLVGQLQDKISTGAEWAAGIETITEAIAQAIEAKLDEFVRGKTQE